MNAKTFASVSLAFAFCTLSYTTASAGHGQEGSQGQQCEDQEGDISGDETLNAKIILVATADAPEGAKGCAKLEAENQDGIQITNLKIKTTGLAAGDYTVSVVRKSDGSSVTLGQITIADCMNSDGEDDNDDQDEAEINHNSSLQDDNQDGNDDGDNENEDGDGDHQGHGSGSGGGCELRSESEMELPADLDPMDIAQIIISDTSDTPMLVGDFVDAVSGTKIKFKASIDLTPDEGAPGCQGTARMSCTANSGKHKDRFTMVASNVPTNSTFDVQVDGTVVGQAKSNKKGKVLVKKLPANLLKVRSVKLKDSEGQTVANAKF